MVSLPDGEKFEDTFIRFDRVHERDRQTDVRTPHDDIGRPCIAYRATIKLKNWFYVAVMLADMTYRSNLRVLNKCRPQNL